MTTAVSPERQQVARKKLSPRKRAQYTRIAQYLVLALLAIGAVVSIDGGALQRSFFRPDLIASTLTYEILYAFGNTLAYTVGAFIIGLLIGTLLALMKLSQVAPYRWIATIYTEFFRGVPALIVIMVFSNISIVFPGFKIPWDPYLTVWLALGMVSSAYMSETIRAGVQAVPKGQVEAARALGMPAGMASHRIVLPQAFRIVIPPLTNELILLTKDSSLVYIMGLTGLAFELTKYGRFWSDQNANMTPLMIAALCYLIITVPLSILVRRMEAKAD
ncbi:MAG: amino acid ABC transporter permease, partial [Propionibacteriaceae bacterium]|nr:amino acid ABC transporter permease [Propionibacteriaceae bacterium]